MTPLLWEIFQIALYLAVLLACVKPLGWYMARVLADEPCGLDFVLGPLERGIYRLAGVKRGGRPVEMDWKRYAQSALVVTMFGAAVVYALQRLQSHLPWNPQELGAVAPDLALNTAVSFVTNTNWQSYGGETTMSNLTQALGLGVQNFLSAATGIAVLGALIRALARRRATTIGNFWVDLTRATLYILLPLSVILAAILIVQGVPQTLAPALRVQGIEQPNSVQTIPLGPVASQVAIKQLGTNGGGFYNTNSAHPLENPTPFSNFLQMLAILLIPAALCWTYGDLVRDRRQGWALLSAMGVILVMLVALVTWSELRGNPALTAIGVDQTTSALQPGGNMEGKEARFGPANSALWAAVTTAASNGSVNSMHDSFTPLGGLVPMWLMQLGEVIFGGVGSGLYGMVLFVIVAVFLAGLMVGRAPEYLGKKIDPFEMKMAAIGILAPCALVLVGTAVAVMRAPDVIGTSNPGPHGFSQVLYAYSSASNNNGSAFAGFGANVPFTNTAMSICMLFGRFLVLLPVLAIAGSMVRKNATPPSSGTLPTHTPLFVVLLIGVVLIVGALTFIPALALGPIAEHVALVEGHTP